MAPPPPVPTLPAVQPDMPRSFLERGVAAPFTTPLLAGARLRRALPVSVSATERAMMGTQIARAVQPSKPRPLDIEIIVPSPGGLRGVYILSWRDIGALCRPTLHDAFLCAWLTAQTDPATPLTPVGVRIAARETARRGYAGRAAARAADAFTEDEAQQLTATRFALLLEIIRQTEPHGHGMAPEAETPEGVEQRAQIALGGLAAVIGEPPSRLVDLVDQMAAALLETGVGPTRACARITLLVSAIETMRTELREMAATRTGEQNLIAGGHSAALIASCADVVIRMANALLQRLQARLSHMPSIIRDWLARPDEVVALALRPDWIVNGWEQICLIWQTARSGQSPSSALQDMLAHLPTLPDEAEQWLGLPAGTTARLNSRGADISLVWRTDATMLDRIARNEHLRALAG